jgi:hypothetical protein
LKIQNLGISKFNFGLISATQKTQTFKAREKIHMKNSHTTHDGLGRGWTSNVEAPGRP